MADTEAEPAATSGKPDLEPVSIRAKFFFEGDRKMFVQGVTYGPFAPDANGDFVGDPEKARRDFALVRDMGGNLLRVYHPPPSWFLDLAAEFGLRVLITIPWTQHIEFLNRGSVRRKVVAAVREAVGKNRGHPAIFGYLVGNEIPSSIVRWLGPRRVTFFVEELIEAARAVDPRPLYSYASYPPTEYLLPQNVDFLTFNVYLHRQEDFDRYLARLQNLAEDKPLLFGEFGMDTIRHTEEEQAEMLGWHLDSVVKGGAAGTILFSWTDEWFTGGSEITDWAFGLVTRDRKPKKAWHMLRAKLKGEGPVTSRVRLPRYPKVSVIVCSYNGGKTLGDCLGSLDRLNYPDYEVVLVDDGSRDNTQEIVAEFERERGAAIASGAKRPPFLNIVQQNMGLSYARNAGAWASSGEVVAYTDSDCMADPDWLYYMVGTLLSGEYVGVGGPNISPPAVDWIQAAVAAAPGGPSHVLLSDVVAEHIPGCNMAFYREAFDSVGGFDVSYRKAGDDVDFCWRLQVNGGVIAFSPAAIVWHYRRFTLDAFRKQQEGYGEAESMLRFKHLIFFGPTGTAKWKGQIYGAPRFAWLLNQPVIYHGVFGHGLFQSVYPVPQSEVAAYLSSIEWVVLTAFLAAVSVFFPAMAVVPYLMLGGTLLVALSYMLAAKIEPRFDTVRARLLVAFLAFSQPLARGWARYTTWYKFQRTPRKVIAKPEAGLPLPLRRGGASKLDFWNEAGVGREKLLEETLSLLVHEGWRYSSDTGWANWDLQIYGNFWWYIQMRTVTEYHGGPKCLTRVRLVRRPTLITFLALSLLALLVIFRHFAVGHPDWILKGIFAALAVALAVRAIRIKRRVADLVLAAANRCGLHRVRGGGNRKPADGR
jgi:glycosyltransferase involved in cell wall biosynthesis